MDRNCSRCKELKKFDAFPKDRRKPYGYAYTCKSCKAIERKAKRDTENARWYRYYAPGSENRKRHMVRSQTRRKYGTAKNRECSLCNNPAEEWHHLAYATDWVIPLCRSCHLEI